MSMRVSMSQKDVKKIEQEQVSDRCFFFFFFFQEESV